MTNQNDMKNQSSENLGLIQISDNAYCRVNNIIADVDIVDIDGYPLTDGDTIQSPHSKIELTGRELVGLELPISVIASKVFGNK